MRFRTSVFVALFGVLILTSACFCATGWKAYPAIHTVRSMISVGQDLRSATNAGLLRFKTADQSIEIFTTVDGLSSNDVRTLIADDLGNLILGMGDAYVDIFNLQTHQVTWLSDFKFNSKIFQVISLYFYSGAIYVGTDIGVSRLLFYENLGEYHIQGNFDHLGSFPLEIAAKAITIHDGGLWVGTEMGLARGDLSSSGLESPSSWANFTTLQGLSSNIISALEIYRDTLYVATPATGLNYQSGSVFIPLQIPYTTSANFLKALGDTLYFGRPDALCRLASGAVIAYGISASKARCVAWDPQGRIWAGFEPVHSFKGGLSLWTGLNWAPVIFNSSQVEQSTAILASEFSGIWVCGRQNLGFNNGCLSHFDGNQWINYTIQSDVYSPYSAVSPDSFFWYRPNAMAEDNSNSVWVASDGRGVGWYGFQGDTVIAKGFYSSPSGRLTNIQASGHYCVVRDLIKDAWGNIWICNSEASPLSGLPIAIVSDNYIESPSDTVSWEYLSPKTQNGNPLSNGQFYTDQIAIDSFGRKWFGANNNVGSGINILDDHGTPSPSDDQWWALSNLPSDSISDIVCDREGVMWVATPGGTQYFYPDSDPLVLYGIDLIIPTGYSNLCITVDPQNNKWFGTTTGMSVLSSDNYTWLPEYNLTTWGGVYPSPLPGNYVGAISIDPKTGVAYVGTDAGLVSMATPFSEMGERITAVNALPNPFIISDGNDDRLYFEPSGLSSTTEIKIFTSAGLLVKHLQGVQQINSGWDGRNSAGELIGSGIYLILAYSSSGQAQTGKVAIIRK